MESSATTTTASSGSAQAAEGFHRTLSDITDEDLELLVAERVTCGSFSSWFVAIVVVYFDALEGQKVLPLCHAAAALSMVTRCQVEELFPKTKGISPLAPEELRIICYSAFPDSMSATVGDYSFAFRFRGSDASPFLYAARTPALPSRSSMTQCTGMGRATAGSGGMIPKKECVQRSPRCRRPLLNRLFRDTTKRA
jgi:hypothetical protein